jgi:formate dehydrogenase accessory protein FdhE
VAAREVLRFYAAVLNLQAEIFQDAQQFKLQPDRPLRSQLNLDAAADWLPRIGTLAEKRGPHALAEKAREISQRRREQVRDLLTTVASTPLYDPQQVEQFFARAVLQPCAEALARQMPPAIGYSGSACPFCDGAPQAAVLRPEGDGGKRFLLCSFCLREWEFRRVICAWCGEEDHHKLPRFGADGLPHMTVFACDTCKHYLKAVDLTVTGLAVPLVDEVAAAPLDLWAVQQGYAKTVPNLMGM